MAHECPSCKAALKPDELGLVPTARLTEESAKRTAAEKAAQDAQKQLTDLTASNNLAQLRLSLSGEAVISERNTKQVYAAYKADIEGNEKPPSLADWLKGDGATWGAVLKAAQAPVPPAPPTSPATQTPPAPASPPPPPSQTPPAPPAPQAPNPPPNTNPGTVSAAPNTGLTPEQYSRMSGEIATRYVNERNPAEKAKIRAEQKALDERFKSSASGQA